MEVIEEVQAAPASSSAAMMLLRNSTSLCGAFLPAAVATVFCSASSFCVRSTSPASTDMAGDARPEALSKGDARPFDSVSESGRCA